MDSGWWTTERGLRSSSPTAPRSRTASSALGGLAAPRSSRPSSARRSSSTARRRSAPPRAPTARRRRTRSSLYGTKAFPNVALLRLLAAEGLGADVSTLGELAFARARRDPGRAARRARQQQERRGAARRGRGGRALRRARRARRGRAGAPPPACARVLVRVTPGIEADTHEAIRTAHHGSKFGLPPDEALEAIARARKAGLEVAGLHVHIGSQLLDPRAGARRRSTGSPASPRVPRRARLDAAVVDLGGGLGDPLRRGERAARDRRVRRHAARAGSRTAGPHATAAPQVILEPGRSLVGQAGVTLYRVGVGQAGERRGRRTSPSTAACPTTRGPQLYGAPLHARCSPTAPTRSRREPTPSAASTASPATC